MLSKALKTELNSLEKVNRFLSNATEVASEGGVNFVIGKDEAVKIGVLGGKRYESHLKDHPQHTFKMKDLIKHVQTLSHVDDNNYQDVKSNLADVYIKIIAVDHTGEVHLEKQKGLKQFAIMVRKICAKIFRIPHAIERIPHPDKINDHVAMLLQSLQQPLEMEEEVALEPKKAKRKDKSN